MNCSSCNAKCKIFDLFLWNVQLGVREDVASSRPGWPWGPLDTSMARRVIQGYYAATTYIDSLVGRILERTDNNTVIVLLSDHGWSLGQHGEWCKMSNYEEAVRVPFIVLPPPSYHHQQGSLVSQYTELVDLFPSLAEGRSELRRQGWISSGCE